MYIFIFYNIWCRMQDRIVLFHTYCLITTTISAAGIPVILIPDQVPANDETRPLCKHVLQDLSQLADIMNTL